MKNHYLIETRNDAPGATGQVPWACDTIGDNPPRSYAECQADIEAFKGGACGPEFAESFANEADYRIVRIVDEA